MRFSRIVGKTDKAIVKKAEDALAATFMELSMRYDNPSPVTNIGGDPFIFTLSYPAEQVCTEEIGTAATDGKRYFWNPEFVNKLSRIGLRIVIAHEAFHAIFMHPARRGGRIPWLWNIAVDYIVNWNIMHDFRQRNLDHVKLFKENLGDFLTLKVYAEALKGNKKKDPKDDKAYYFADPDLADEMRKPEAIYEFLYNQIPKCPKCGKPDPYASHGGKKPQKAKGKDKGNQPGGKKPGDADGEGKEKGPKGKGKGKQPGDGHDHGDGEGCGDQPGDQSGEGQGDGDGDGEGEGQGQGCNHGSGGDPTGYGSLVDDHMDAEGTQDELAKKLADAASISQKLAGRVPAGMEDEIGTLLAPKLRWQDVIRSKLQRVRQGNGRADWNRFKIKPLLAGLMIPKRKDYFAKFHALIDTSGSMSTDDMSWGLSQLQAIDTMAEGTITPADASVYWEDSIKIQKATKEEILKTKIVGRGGTMFGSFFTEYEQKLGEADFLMIITDGYLCEGDMPKTPPKIPVYWILTANHSFTPSFGKVFNLHNE